MIVWVATEKERSHTLNHKASTRISASLLVYVYVAFSCKVLYLRQFRYPGILFAAIN